MLIHVPGPDSREIKLRFGLGSKVALKITPEIHAIVIGVVIRAGEPLYECNWVNDNGLQAALLNDFEMDALPENGTPGFGSQKEGS